MLVVTTAIAYGSTLFAGFIFMLGFGEEECVLMIALYIAMDSFGTACNCAEYPFYGFYFSGGDYSG